MKIVESFQNRLKTAMSIRNIKQVDLVEKAKIDKTLLNKYLAGISNASQKKLTVLADALDVNEVWLMGYDVSMQRTFDNNITENEKKTIDRATVFVYGTIPAGTPIELIEDILDTEEIDADMLKGEKQYFGLKIKGNSMYPEYLDGDTIILEKVDNCENGQDCVVMVNGDDGTFKRVFKNENGIILQPLNPEFQPMVYTNEQIEKLPIKIIGKVVELRRKK